MGSTGRLADGPSLLATGGGHPPGLVWAMAGGAGPAARILKPDEIEPALEASEGWVWLHVDLVDQRAGNFLTRHCRLPPAARAVIEAGDTSVCLDFADGAVHGVFVDFHRELTERTTNVGYLAFAVTERLLVTGRRHPLAAPAEARKALQDGARAASAFDAFGVLIMTFAKSVSQRLHAAAQELDAVEDQLVTEQTRNERLRLKAVRRLAVSVHRPVAALVSLFNDDEREDWPLSEDAHRVLRRLSQRLESLDREILMIGDRARLLQEEMAADLQEESNRSLRALAIISAFLLPGTLVTGFFGMNVGGLPLLGIETGAILATIVGVGATGLFYWLLKRAGADLRF